VPQAAARAATAVLGPVLDGSVPVDGPPWGAQAFLLEAIAQDALGDPAAAGRALERTLDLAEPDGALQLFLLHPAPGLLERQAGHRAAHAALIADIISRLADQAHAPSAGPQPLLEPLRDSEIRVLRYLPTHLTLPEIARELHVSHNAAVNLTTDYGAEVDVVVDRNLLAGGLFAIDAGAARGSHDIRVTGNHFSRRYSSAGGSAGPVIHWDGGARGAVWSGNVWDETGEPVPPR